QDGFKAGDTVTVNLSSLLFTTGEPRDEKVTATFAGQEVGTFAVDATAGADTDNTDEVGRATVEFVVPAEPAQRGATNADLVITGETTGTTVTVSIPLAADTGPACTVTITGRHTGPLTVSSGVTCLDGAAVSGPVTVRKGASLYATGARVSGPISVTNAADVS